MCVRVCVCVVGPGITPVPSFLSIPLSFLSPQSLCRRGDAPPPLLLGPPICHSAHWWSLGGSLCVCVVRMLLSARITQASELQLNTQVRYTLLTVFCCCFFKNTHSWGLLWRSFISTCVCVWQFFSRLMLTWRHFDCREIFEAALAACCSLSFCARVCVCYQFTCCRCYRVVSRSRMLSCCCGSVTFPPWLVFFAYKATQGCCLFRWWCVGGNFACHAFWGRRLQLESAGKERKWVLANTKLAVCSISQQSQRQHHSLFRFVVSTLFTAEWQEKTPTAGRALCAHRWTIKGAISGYGFILLYLHTLSFHFKEPVKKL